MMENENTRTITDDVVLSYIARMIKYNNNVECEKTTFEKDKCNLLIKDKKTNEVKKLKFKYRYMNGNNILGWYTHILHESFLLDENIDYIVFSICSEVTSRHLIFSKNDIAELVADKTVDNHGNYFFCFNIKEDSVVEIDKDEREIDVTKHVDNWKL